MSNPSTAGLVELARPAGPAGYVPPADPLLTAREAAAERRQALSTFWLHVKAGHVPPAVYVAPKSPRWRRSEIIAGIEATRRA